MHKHKSLLLILFLALTAIAPQGLHAQGKAGKRGGAATSRDPNRLAVLDFVDLVDNHPKPEVSDFLRRSLVATRAWSVIPRDSVARRLGEFNLNPSQPCNNPQCSFDIGNVVQADYVLYGTSSPLGSTQVVTLKLLHIATAKIIWTRVLEAGGVSDAERASGLEQAFTAMSSELANARLEVSKEHHGQSLAVIDLSENSLQSRVFFERIHTRIHGNPSYDPMSPGEMAELLSALEINKYSIVPSLDNMIGLGQQLGVSHLLYSRLYRDGRSFIYRLAMYDVENRSLVLELPPQPSEDLIKLLDYERVFFNTLFSKESDRPRESVMKSGDDKSKKAFWISMGVLGVGGGMAAYWVENLRKSGSSGGEPGVKFKEPPEPPPRE